MKEVMQQASKTADRATLTLERPNDTPVGTQAMYCDILHPAFLLPKGEMLRVDAPSLYVWLIGVGLCLAATHGGITCLG
jgi:hypothetical protein